MVLLFVHLYLYRALKLTFPWDIGGLEFHGLIINEMSQGSMGVTVVILTRIMSTLLDLTMALFLTSLNVLR